METTLTGGSDAKLEGESEARAWNLEEGRRRSKGGLGNSLVTSSK